jgi:hypothetical protein
MFSRNNNEMDKGKAQYIADKIYNNRYIWQIRQIRQQIIQIAQIMWS